MLQIKYIPLFDIEILHSFYNNGRSADIEIIPSQDCLNVMQRYALRFVQTDFGGKLFAEVLQGDIIKRPLAEGTKFSFVLRLKTTFFETFTLLNLNKPTGNFYYFNNLVQNISEDSFPLLVTDTISGIVTDDDQVPFAVNSFSYVHSSNAATQTAELQMIDSGETFEQTLNNDNNSNIFNFSFDLAKTSAGRAKLFIEGIEKKSFYVSAPINETGIFGMVEIFHKSTLPDTYRFQQDDRSIQTKLYKISFANRATRWRYIISKKFNNAITGVSAAKTNGTAINFTSQVNPPAGQFILASNNPVPLTEEPVTGIKLSDQSNKVIIPNLPNPSLVLVKTEGADAFSDILITI